MLEVGRAQRSIFLAAGCATAICNVETTAGLNVVENYNGVNDYISFGKRGEMASNRREEQELAGHPVPAHRPPHRPHRHTPPSPRGARP